LHKWHMVSRLIRSVRIHHDGPLTTGYPICNRFKGAE
jgi:hypothetical protein